MTTPTKRPEEFKALVEYSNEDVDFVANKVNIASSTDITGVACWTIMAFQDTVKSDGYPEVNGIHIYLPKNVSTAEVDLGEGLSPPHVKKNSASYFKIVDKIEDEKKELNTILEYLGTGGAIKYQWIDNNEYIEGNFGFSAIDDNNKSFKVNGYFYIRNNGPHKI